jgi:cytoskeleton protein RodZ
MSELGRLLAEARAAKELSLADVEAATRIRQKYLEALETGAYTALPRGAVARGFLRTYARFLGLDEADTLHRYAQESGDTGGHLEIPEPGKPRLTDYRPIEVELSDTRVDLGWLRWVIALLVVAAIAVAVWWALNGNLGWNPLAGLGPAPTATPTAPPTATRTAIVVTATAAPTSRRRLNRPPNRRPLPICCPCPSPRPSRRSRRPRGPRPRRRSSAGLRWSCRSPNAPGCGWWWMARSFSRILWMPVRCARPRPDAR